MSFPDLHRIHRKKFGAWLKRKREKARKTQWDVAEAQKYDTPQFVSNWERGVSLPPILELGPIAEVIGVTPNEILAQMRKCEEAVTDAKYKEAMAHYRRKK